MAETTPAKLVQEPERKTVSFGTRLKRERESRGIALDDVSIATKISLRMLRALEEEKFDQLPGGIFNKGFVRAYARHLGIDEEQAVADYLEAAGEITIPQTIQAPENIPAPPKPPKEHAADIPWGMLAIILLAAALGLSLWSYHTRENSPGAASPEVAPPQSHSVAAQPTTSTEAAPSEAAGTQAAPSQAAAQPSATQAVPGSVQSQPVVNESAPPSTTAPPQAARSSQIEPLKTAPSQPVQAAPTQSPPAQSAPAQPAPGKPPTAQSAPAQNTAPRSSPPNAASSVGSNFITSAPAPRGTTSNQSTQAPNSQAPAAGTPAAASAAKKSSLVSPDSQAASGVDSPKPPAAATAPPFVLLIEAEDNSWVSITADGKTVLDGTLIAPAVKSIKAQNQIVVKAGNVGALSFTLNGKKLPPQGEAGQVKTLTFSGTGLDYPTATPNLN
jgi:cytoskeleton protein RodZ